MFQLHDYENWKIRLKKTQRIYLMMKKNCTHMKMLTEDSQNFSREENEYGSPIFGSFFRFFFHFMTTKLQVS